MAEKKIYSKVGEALAKGEFVLTGELEPEKTCDLSHTIQEAKEMVAKVKHYKSNHQEVMADWRNTICFIALWASNF